MGEQGCGSLHLEVARIKAEHRDRVRRLPRWEHSAQAAAFVGTLGGVIALVTLVASLCLVFYCGGKG